MTRIHWKNDVQYSLYSLDLRGMPMVLTPRADWRSVSCRGGRKPRKAKHGTIRSGFTVFERGQGNENATETNSGPKAQAVQDG